MRTGKREKPGSHPLVSASPHRRRWFPLPACLSPAGAARGPPGRRQEERGEQATFLPVVSSRLPLPSCSLLPGSRLRHRTLPQTQHPPGHLGRWRGVLLGPGCQGARSLGLSGPPDTKALHPALCTGTGRPWWLRPLSRAGWDFAARWGPGRQSPASSRCRASGPLHVGLGAECRPAPAPFPS